MKTALVSAILGVIVVVAGVGYFDMAGSSMNVVIMAFGVALLVAAAVGSSATARNRLKVMSQPAERSRRRPAWQYALPPLPALGYAILWFFSAPSIGGPGGDLWRLINWGVLGLAVVLIVIGESVLVTTRGPIGLRVGVAIGWLAAPVLIFAPGIILPLINPFFGHGNLHRRDLLLVIAAVIGLVVAIIAGIVAAFREDNEDRRRPTLGGSPSRWVARWNAMLVLIGSLALTVLLLGVDAVISRPPVSGESGVTFSGSGEMDTAPQHLSGGDYDVRWFVWPNRFYLTCAFVVKLGGADVGTLIDLANVELRNAPILGTTRVNAVAPGEYVGHAMSSCGEWRVALTSR